MKYYLIHFEDASMRPEVFTDKGCAIGRYIQLLHNWNCHLFEQISDNGRDLTESQRERDCRLLCAWKGGSPCLLDDCPRRRAQPQRGEHADQG